MMKEQRCSVSQGDGDGDGSTGCGAEDVVLDFRSDLDITYDYDCRFSPSLDGVAALKRDILTFETDSKIPEDLDWHVSSSEDDQKNWYEELSKAWMKSEPNVPTEATNLVYHSLRKIYGNQLELHDLEGFLYFYGLPQFYTIDFTWFVGAFRSPFTPLLEEHASAFKLVTLPVLKNRVTDGGGFTVSADASDRHILPIEILYALSERRRALAKGDCPRAREMLNQINTTRDYEVVNLDNVELLTKKYEIRIRGIRAPKIGMRYGIEARDVLRKMVTGKCLKISVYYVDDFKCFGDAHCSGKSLREHLLKKGATLPYWEEDKMP